MTEHFGGRFQRFFDVDALRATGAKPAWFGLGFIQLKLDKDSRLHFWHPELLPDTPEEELHDHRYRFRSHILVGELVHEEWFLDPDPEGDHEMVLVSCAPGKEAPPEPVGRGRLRQGSTYTMRAGSEYEFAETGFHRIRATRAVTCLERGPVVKDFANVIRPFAQPSVCPFSRSIPEERLWDYIADLMQGGSKPGYHLREIPRGVVGEASKVLEEALEFSDACEQGCDVMGLVELSDLVGSVKAWLASRHPTVKLADLERMADITARAFRNGHR